MCLSHVKFRNERVLLAHLNYGTTVREYRTAPLSLLRIRRTYVTSLPETVVVDNEATWPLVTPVSGHSQTRESDLLYGTASPTHPKCPCFTDQLNHVTKSVPIV